MIAAASPTPAPTSAPDTKPAPAPQPPVELHQRFTDLAGDLTSADETLASMVAGRNPVGDGWGPHLSSIAERMQSARDAFLDARPADAELGARLGADVLRIAQASGSLSIMARQRATLSEGWSAFLDTAIANATAAAALVSDPPPAAEPAPPDAEPAPSPAAVS